MPEDRPPRGPAALSTLPGVVAPPETDGSETTPGGTATPTQDTLVHRAMLADSLPIVLPEPGYQMGEMIGQGGMGEIIAAHDQRIGREVAIKRMRGARADAVSVARFLREARIQARLDHPAIVPVHELGTDAEGRPFFTMKRLTAVMLFDKLAQGGPLQPLLRAFIDVCMAVEFAHTRGVVHRDLKPANIMVGDYNEVYVIDWGVARVLAERTPTTNRGDIGTLEDGTMTGGLLGTPGYMSPEQIEGGDVVTATDVYALGSILFEILAGESLHPRGRGAIAATLDEPQDSPARRRPDRAIAPELDATCFAALAKDPAERPTARELGDRVQAYLDGDRDLERRRTLAAEQLARAREALESSDPDARALAMRLAGRALALDPESEAAEIVTQMLVEPPRVLPPELAKSLAAEDLKASSARSRRGMLGYTSVFAFLLAIPWMTVASWPWLIALNVVLLGLVAFTFYSSRVGRVNAVIALAGNFALALVWTRLASPFMLTPVLVCGVASALAANPALFRQRALLIAWVVATMTAPILLEAIGVLESSWQLSQGVFMVRSTIFASPGMIDGIALVAANTIFVVTVAVYAISINRGAYEATRNIHIKEWHMRQMLPNMPTRRATPEPRPSERS